MKEMYFTIAGCNHYYGSDFMEKGMKVKLVKEPDNEYDNEAIQVKIKGLGKVGYYKPTTVTANTYSWGDRIRTIIGKNYPCILGLTSHPRYGEHWVVVTGYNFTSHNSGTYTVNDGWGNVGININSSYTDGGVDIG